MDYFTHNRLARDWRSVIWRKIQWKDVRDQRRALTKELKRLYMENSAYLGLFLLALLRRNELGAVHPGVAAILADLDENVPKRATDDAYLRGLRAATNPAPIQDKGQSE